MVVDSLAVNVEARMSFPSIHDSYSQLVRFRCARFAYCVMARKRLDGLGSLGSLGSWC